MDGLEGETGQSGLPVDVRDRGRPSAQFARESSPVTRTRKRLRIGYNSESFSTKSTLSGGLNRIHDEIPLAWDEIRLDGGWVDLISSEAAG